MSVQIALIDYQKGNIQSVARGLEAAGAEVLVTQDADAITRADAVVLPGVGAFADAMQTIVDLGQDEAIREAIGRGTPFLGICLGLHLMFEAGEEHAEGDALTPGLGLLPGAVRRMPRTDAHGAPYKIPHVGWNAVDLINPASISGGEGSRAHEESCIGNREDEDSCRFPSVPSVISEIAYAGGEGGNAHKASSAAKRGLSERLSVPPFTLNDACPLFHGIPSGEHFYFTHSYIAPESDATIATTTHSVTFPCAVQQDAAFGVQFHPEKSSDAGERLLANFVRFVRKA